MLNPTEVHFLVGLLTQISRPDGVEIELGDMVLDDVTGTERDVDITIRVTDSEGGVSVFEGIEVKDHSRPLDVSHVEQLCAKLNDMQSITSRAIVSSSGYTAAAVRKAAHHNVELLELRDWGSIKRMGSIILSDDLDFTEKFYEWSSSIHTELAFDPPIDSMPLSNSWLSNPIFDSRRQPIEHGSTLQALLNGMIPGIFRFAESKGMTSDIPNGVPQPIDAHIRPGDEIYSDIEGTMRRLISMRFTGHIVRNEQRVAPDFKVLFRQGETEPVIGCAVYEMGNKSLGGLTFGPNNDFGFVHISISDRNLRKIYRRKL
jgi:hypothetical protein